MEWGEIFTNKHIAEFAIKEKHELAGPVSRLEDLSHDKGGETAWSQGGQCSVGAPLPPAPGQLTAHCAVLLAVWVQGPLTTDHPHSLSRSSHCYLIIIIACMISIKADRFLVSIVSVLVCDIRFITP